MDDANNIKIIVTYTSGPFECIWAANWGRN